MKTWTSRYAKLNTMQDVTALVATSIQNDLGVHGSGSWLDAVDWDNVLWLILTFTVSEQALLSDGVSPSERHH